jgi:glycosyltransferase involved in cell wall biosynthesis
MKKEKGPFEILESTPIVLSKFPSTKFIFIGSGKDLGKLKEKSKKMLLNKNVEFTGYITLGDKIRRYKESHIFVFPTFHGEGFPTVILEAMAAGLPVVTTANAGLVGAIENGREGFLLKTMPSEPKEIAEKIIILTENPELMKNISKNNLKRAKEEFDVKVVSRQIAAMYRKIKRRE